MATSWTAERKSSTTSDEKAGAFDFGIFDTAKFDLARTDSIWDWEDKSSNPTWSGETKN